MWTFGPWLGLQKAKKEKVAVDMEVDDSGGEEVASMVVDEGHTPEPDTPPPSYTP